MADGEGHWTAISELRATGTRHERELGTLSTKQASQENDINKIGEEARKARHEMRNALTASELRVTQHVDERVDGLEDRINRLISTGRWVIGLAVPTVCTLLGLLIGRS